MKTIALITGIAGQDGSYLSELLLSKGYEVHGVVRAIAFEDIVHKLHRIKHIMDNVQLHSGSLDNYASVIRILEEVQPQECYHLAAQSFVGHSLETGFSGFMSDISSTQQILSGVRQIVPKCRVYFAGSSEMFGNATYTPQNEHTPFNPRSVYGISKVAGYHLTMNYKDVYGIHGSAGILYNHESPRRGYEFVTRKVTSTAARIKMGLADELRLGNLDAKRDWGHAREYVNAMWLMLQQEQPDTFVIATGESRSVREFVAKVFEYLDMDYQDYVKVDKRLFRQAEPVTLCGDSTRARRSLGWEYNSSLEELIREMVEADMDLIKQGRL